MTASSDTTNVPIATCSHWKDGLNRIPTITSAVPAISCPVDKYRPVGKTFEASIARSSSKFSHHHLINVLPRPAVFHQKPEGFSEPSPTPLTLHPRLGDTSLGSGIFLEGRKGLQGDTNACQVCEETPLECYRTMLLINIPGIPKTLKGLFEGLAKGSRKALEGPS